MKIKGLVWASLWLGLSGALSGCAGETAGDLAEDEEDTGQASSAVQYVSENRKVCVESIVHDVQSGTYIGTLKVGQTIHVQVYTEYWAHGVAYGNVNKYGRVLRANLCPK